MRYVVVVVVLTGGWVVGGSTSHAHPRRRRRRCPVSIFVLLMCLVLCMCLILIDIPQTIFFALRAACYTRICTRMHQCVVPRCLPPPLSFCRFDSVPTLVYSRHRSRGLAIDWPTRNSPTVSVVAPPVHFNNPTNGICCVFFFFCSPREV